MCIVCRHDTKTPRPRIGGEWQPDVQWNTGRRRASFHSSWTEVWQIAVALVVLTAAFTIWLGCESFAGSCGWLGHRSIVERAVIALIAMGSGFVLHELMHKFVAQFYGHWAEFRGSVWGLAIPVPLALFTGFIFAAPGAVVISGFVKRHENGIISAAGPLTNIVIAAIAWPFTRSIGTVETFGYELANTTLIANGLLGAFNLIPIGVLDGRKILRWNKLAYALLVVAAVALFVAGVSNAL